MKNTAKLEIHADNCKISEIFLKDLNKRMYWSYKHPLPTTQEPNLHMDKTRLITKIRLIIFSAAKDGEALYS